MPSPDRAIGPSGRGMSARLSRAAALGVLTTLAMPRFSMAQGAVAMRVGSTPADDATPLLYGMTSGLFRQAGLDVSITRFAIGAAMTSAVAGGALEVAAQATMPLITGHARGIAFTMVAPGAVHRTAVRTALLLVRADSPIRTARDLNGKIVASNSLGDVNTLAVRNWVDQNGGDSSTLHPVELPYSVMAAALLDGRIAAASILSPILDQALQAGGLRRPPTPILTTPRPSISSRPSPISMRQRLRVRHVASSPPPWIRAKSSR